MTGVTTGQTSLPTATDSDDNEGFLTGPLTTALQTLVNLFDSLTGHAHDGAGKGKPITVGGLDATVGNFGAWVGFTPTLTQGVAVSVTVNKAAYNKVGRQATAFIQVTASSAGTAASAIVIGAIPAAIAPVTANTAAPVGVAYLGFSPVRIGAVVWASATQLEIWVDNNTGVAGAGPAVTLANGIVVSLTATWETAS